MSESFGRRLRLERERRKIRLTTIADDTKISVTLLEGLERDDLSRWPAGIFRRSFVRSYAEAIGLDPETLLHEFLTVFPDPGAQAPDATGVQAPSPVAHAPLRLTFDEGSSWFSCGPLLGRARARWAAAACDVAALLGVGVTAFVLVGRFWLPFGVSSLVYYTGAILVMGNTPGVRLFCPAMKLDAFTSASASLPKRDHPDEVTSHRDPLHLVRSA